MRVLRTGLIVPEMEAVDPSKDTPNRLEAGFVLSAVSVGKWSQSIMKLCFCGHACASPYLIAFGHYERATICCQCRLDSIVCAICAARKKL